MTLMTANGDSRSPGCHLNTLQWPLFVSHLKTTFLIMWWSRNAWFFLHFAFLKKGFSFKIGTNAWHITLIYPFSPESNFRKVHRSKIGVPQGPVLRSPYFGEKKCKILKAIICHTPPDPRWWLVPRFTRDAISQWSKETHVGISILFQKKRL